MPLVRRSTPMFSHPPINYVRRPTRRAFLAAALAGPAAAHFLVLPGGRQRGLGDCIPGQPSTDPNCFTTPAYIRALNLKQVAGEEAQGLLPSTGPGGSSASCYDTYMAPGPGFNPDAYNRCIGAQDVTSAVFNVAAAAGVPFASNPYQSVVPVDRTPPPAPAPAPKPPAPAQSNAPAPVVVGGGAGQSNAPPTGNVPPIVGASCFKLFGGMESCIGPIGSMTAILGLVAVGGLWAFGGRR